MHRLVVAAVHGEYSCHVSRSTKRALIRWTDELTNTYGVMDGTSRDLDGLWDAWLELGPRFDRGVEVGGDIGTAVVPQR